MGEMANDYICLTKTLCSTAPNRFQTANEVVHFVKRKLRAPRYRSIILIITIVLVIILVGLADT